MHVSVIIHDTILACATDATSGSAAKYASLYALDALEGDPGFMPRTCDCRAQAQSRKTQSKKHIDMRGFAEEDDVVAVEELVQVEPEPENPGA